jgi:phage terminase large subunit
MSLPAVVNVQEGDLVPIYQPRHHFNPFHVRAMRWACLVVHRRGGKTVACVNEIITRASYTQKENARFAYIAPFYRQAKDVAWEYLKQFGAPFIKGRPRESELRVELFNGSWITLYGADNPDALRGLYLDGVVLDEYGDCRPSLWGTVVLPTLADRKGWAVFIGTPKGKNHFYDVHKRAEIEDKWYSLKLPASVSGILDQEELDEMRAQMTEEAYNQELECDFEAAVLGTYYANIIQGLEQCGAITPQSGIYDPREKVHVATDLGFTDNTALWFWQETRGGYNIIDYYENQMQPLDHYLEYLDDKPYTYQKIWLPHDAKAKTFQTGRSTVEQILAHYQKSDVQIDVAPKLDVQDGIDAARLILPSCSFNQVKCYGGIEALRAYRRSWDEVKKVYSDKPVHDWASDGADAFRYFALACKPKASRKVLKAKQRVIINRPLYKLDDLWDDREKKSHRYETLRM